MKRKVLQHKFLVYGLAVLVLAIGIINAVEIADYNREVYERQENQANHVYPGKSTFTPYYSLPPIHQQAVLYSALFFLSLIITKRIGFSLLFIFLVFVQHTLFEFIVLLRLRNSDFYFDYPERVYFEWVISAVLILLSFWMALRIERRKTNSLKK